MSHEVEQMFSVREKPWHYSSTQDRTVILADYPGREEAMKLAGHDFKIVEQPIYLPHPEFAGAPGAPFVPVSGYKALIKDKDNRVMNVVNESYGVVQNDVLWDIIEAILDTPNVKYETAGILRHGAVLWVLALLDEPYTVTGDDSAVLPYIMTSTTHDGTGACKVQNIDTRVVCMNTFSAAADESARSQREFTFRHSKNVSKRIEDAKLAIKGIRSSHEAFIELAEELAHTPVTREQRELFVTQMIPMPPDALISDRVKTNVENARGALRGLFNTQTIPEYHEFTGYGLWQAGIEYLDHVRGARNDETRFGRSLLRQEPAKDKLAGLIREVVKA